MALSVLIVDDHPLLRLALVQMLRDSRADAHCHQAATAAEARALLAGGLRFDLALVDQRLPDGQGLKLAQEMQPAVPRVVLLTGAEEPGLAHQARLAGLAGFVPKSLSPEAMAAALQGVLAGQGWFPRQQALAAAH